ncbi:MAG: thioredoxin family protein [Synergistaceae bacterium]|nr:thioredoxin family protein [Synergistaceae bacterium]
MLGFGKKKDKNNCCCGNIDAETIKEAQAGGSAVKVLGMGCSNCKILADNAVKALERLGMEPAVEKITDMAQIAAYGVMSTPALVIGGKVVSAGKVLSTEEIVKLMQKQGAQPK